MSLDLRPSFAFRAFFPPFFFCCGPALGLSVSSRKGGRKTKPRDHSHRNTSISRPRSGSRRSLVLIETGGGKNTQVPARIKKRTEAGCEYRSGRPKLRPERTALATERNRPHNAGVRLHCTPTANTFTSAQPHTESRSRRKPPTSQPTKGENKEAKVPAIRSPQSM